MYILGSYLVSKYAGMSYMDFVETRILTPLDMSSTTFYDSEAARDGKLTQSWSANGRRIPYWLFDTHVEVNAGMGGVISSTVDMVRLRGRLSGCISYLISYSYRLNAS